MSASASPSSGASEKLNAVSQKLPSVKPENPSGLALYSRFALAGEYILERMYFLTYTLTPNHKVPCAAL